GYAVLWAGLASAYFLFASRRPLKTVGFLAVVALLGFATAGVLLVPLLSDWGYTTPYADPWITVTTLGLIPTFLWPLFGLALVGLVGTVAFARRLGGIDHRLLFLGHAALVGAGLAAAGPALGVIDVRFVPFAQLALCLLGGATLGLVLERMQGRHVAALGLVLAGLLYGDARSQVLRNWIDWNYTGLEAKELWPSFRRLSDALEGGMGDPRVAVEYNALHERAGSIRMYETLPFFSGRSTLEGVYNQASLTTHAVYYLASELGATSPNPFREIDYSRFDTDAALDHLRLLNVSQVVALSPQLSDALGARRDASLVERIPPYALFDVEGGTGRYVEPLLAAPVRSSRTGWREKALRWYTRRPLPKAHLVFSDDPGLFTPEPDEWLAPPVSPLEPGVVVEETLEAESLTIRTNRPGHPLLVKMAYHPRWRAEGALGPFLAAPALMVVVPQQETVVLRYARTRGDRLGLLLSVLSLVGAGLWAARQRYARGRAPTAASAPRVVVAPACSGAPLSDGASDFPPPPRRWGGALPAAVLGILVLARFLHTSADRFAPAPELYERASRAYAEERFADAAEYARHAITRSPAPLRDELLCLRGESLLREGQAQAALDAFSTLLSDSPETPYAAQALFSRARAREAVGDTAGAAEDRRRLREEHPGTPWAERLGTLSAQ
ncbi:MAG TPA: 6-pyruvoyl-tetrahydropterin synthase-related protein, partial [Vicinamibacteria bacterium]